MTKKDATGFRVRTFRRTGRALLVVAAVVLGVASSASAHSGATTTSSFCHDFTQLATMKIVPVTRALSPTATELASVLTGYSAVVEVLTRESNEAPSKTLRTASTGTKSAAKGVFDALSSEIVALTHHKTTLAGQYFHLAQSRYQTFTAASATFLSAGSSVCSLVSPTQETSIRSDILTLGQKAVAVASHRGEPVHMSDVVLAARMTTNVRVAGGTLSSSGGTVIFTVRPTALPGVSVRRCAQFSASISGPVLYQGAC